MTGGIAEEEAESGMEGLGGTVVVVVVVVAVGIDCHSSHMDPAEPHHHRRRHTEGLAGNRS